MTGRSLDQDLAAASADWYSADDDTSRRTALQKIIKAFLDWSYSQHLSPKDLVPFVVLAGYLQDLNEGRTPDLMKAVSRDKAGHPGRNTAETFSFAAACAAVDALRTDPDLSIAQSVREVAHKIGVSKGRLDNWRKKLKVGDQGPAATAVYKDMFSTLKGMTPQQVMQFIAKNDWRSIQRTK
jgi:hypothetical protein